MPNSTDYRLYLESEFKGLHKLMNAQFSTVHDKLESLEKEVGEVREQTTRTNGRVNDIESREVTRVVNCPVAAKVEKIDEDLTEYRILKKYPKLGITIIAVFVLSSIFFLREIINKQDVLQVSQDRLKTQVDMINTPVTDKRTGKTYLYPSGMIIDSTIIK